MNVRFAARFVPFGWRHERMLRRPILASPNPGESVQKWATSMKICAAGSTLRVEGSLQ